MKAFELCKILTMINFRQSQGRTQNELNPISIPAECSEPTGKFYPEKGSLVRSELIEYLGS